METNPVSTSTTIAFGAPGGARSASNIAPLEVLPVASAGFDPTVALARLMIENGFARRKAARDERSLALRTMESAQKQELHEMREAADARYAAAIVDATTKIATGVACAGALGASSAGTHLRNGTLHSYGESVMTGMEKAGGKEFIMGVGGLFSAELHGEADEASAGAKEAEYAAEAAKKISEDASDDAKAAGETIDKTIDFLREYESGRSRTQLAALYKA